VAGVAAAREAGLSMSSQPALTRIDINERGREYFAKVMRRDRRISFLVAVPCGILLLFLVPVALEKPAAWLITALPLGFLVGAILDVTISSPGGPYANFIQTLYLNPDGRITRLEMVQLHRRQQISVDIQQQTFTVCQARIEDLLLSKGSGSDPVVVTIREGHPLLRVSVSYEGYYFRVDFFDQNPFVPPHYHVTEQPVWK
jgi:hypothetical protein